MIAQDHVVHWELKRGERADIERLISISRIVEFVIKMDRPYAVNKLILIQGLLASKFGNERRLPKEQATDFALILLKRIRFLAPWYLSDQSHCSLVHLIFRSMS